MILCEEKPSIANIVLLVEEDMAEQCFCVWSFGAELAGCALPVEYWLPETGCEKHSEPFVCLGCEQVSFAFMVEP